MTPTNLLFARRYIGSGDHLEYCVNASSGDVLWTFAAKDAIMSNPTLSPDQSVLYTGSWDHHVYALG